MAGLKLDFVADVSKFLRGTKDVEGALEDVSGSLDDLARDAQNAGDKANDGLEQITADGAVKELRKMADEAREVGSDMSDYFDSAADEVERSAKEISGEMEDELGKVDTAAQKTEKEFKDIFDTVSTDAKKAGDDIGKSTKDGFNKAGEGVEEFKDEANSTAREAAASFDGSAESIMDAFQEVAANAFAGFGPAGAAAGLLIAAGLGTAIAKFTEIAEKVNEAKEKIGELGLEISETGLGLDGIDFKGTMREWAFAIEDPRSAWEFWQDEAVNNLENIGEAAEKAGVPLQGFWEAMASPDTDATGAYLKMQKDRLAEVSDELDRALESQGGYNAVSQETITALTNEKNGLEGLIKPLQDAVDTKQKAYDQSVTLRAAEEKVSEEYIRQKDAVAANNAEIEKSNDLKEEAAALAGDVFLAEGQYVQAVEDATAAIAANGATIDVNTQAGRDNRAALVDTAGATRTYAQTMSEAGASQETVNGVLQRGEADLRAMGAAAGMSQAEIDSLVASMKLTPDSIQTDVKVEGTTQGKSTIDDYNNKINTIPGEVTTTVKFSASTASMQATINEAARGIVPPTVPVNARIGVARAV